MVRELAGLRHSSQCKTHPYFINCIKVKKLFQHVKSCPVRIARGCQAWLETRCTKAQLGSHDVRAEKSFPNWVMGANRILVAKVMTKKLTTAPIRLDSDFLAILALIYLLKGSKAASRVAGTTIRYTVQKFHYKFNQIARTNG
ncbi:hypothetical protein CJ030_MR0G005097 [Morella rubra]|uniref:Uncharacterized protein n=1 Tax=Morella rubra TaxID=262757 RepID=A0A6A1ULF4_9ROSI|nr:hypothetical protein CJ030_MR0G005097 [Morella rubra]